MGEQVFEAIEDRSGYAWVSCRGMYKTTAKPKTLNVLAELRMVCRQLLKMPSKEGCAPEGAGGRLPTREQLPLTPKKP